MMTSPSHTNHNERTHVRFKGPDDVTIRSAWSASIRSLERPSPVARRTTLNKEDGDKAKKDAVKALKDANVLKHELRQIIPILKVGNNDKDDKSNSCARPQRAKTRTTNFAIDSQLVRPKRDKPSLKGTRKTRSAWDVSETRASASSVFGLAPARRQRTLDESELRDAANIATLADAKTKEDTHKTRGIGKAKAGKGRW